MSASVGQFAPDFSVQAYDRTKDATDQKFTQVNLSDYQGKWVCLYFYPLDFTFVCPTEIVAFNDSVGEFANRNCALLTEIRTSFMTTPPLVIRPAAPARCGI